MKRLRSFFVSLLGELVVPHRLKPRVWDTLDELFMFDNMVRIIASEIGYWSLLIQ